MTPTAYLRWRTWVDFKPHGEGNIAQPSPQRALEQFWVIRADESDITLPREMGPGGEMGRWREVEGVELFTKRSD